MNCLYLRYLLFDSFFILVRKIGRAKGVKNTLNNSSPSVYGGAVEVEIGGRGADQVQYLVMIMMLMVVKMVNKCKTFIFISNY